MALPQDGQDANGLTKVTQIPAGKELMFIDPTTNEGGIITLEDLTKQILNGLTSQTFGLDSGTQTLPAAINYLYGKTIKQIFTNESPNDFEWARKYWENITDIDSIKIVYNSYNNEYTYIFSKRAGKNGTVIRWGYSNPQIEMIRFANGNCSDTFFKIIS